MPARRRTHRKPLSTTPRVVLSSCRELVWVDSGKLRKKALQDCQRARTTFEKAETELQVYESVDVPAYQRWYRAQFGPLIEEGRTLQQKIQEVQIRMQRVGAFAGLKGCSFKEAAQFLARDPGGFEAEGERLWQEHKRKEEEAEKKAQEQMQAEMDTLVRRFEHFLRQRKRSIERRLARKAEDPYDIGYELQEEFLCDQRVSRGLGDLFLQDPRMTDLLGKYGIPNELDGDKDPLDVLEEMFERFGGGEANPFAEMRGHPKPHDSARFKTLRRELAFALHPDQNGGGDPRKIELWHQVQEAIAAKDLDRLEVIHAHVQHMEGELNPKAAPISGIRKLTQMYRESREALRRKLRAYKKNREWNFSKKSEAERKRIQDHISREVRDELRHWQRELNFAEEQFRHLSRGKNGGSRHWNPFGHMEAEEDDSDAFFDLFF